MTLNASVPAGYKTTEVGVIPDDWEVEPLGALIGSLDAGVSVRSVSDGQTSFGHGQMVLKTSCISRGRFIPAEAKAILPADLWRAKTPAKCGSILISRMNTPDLVGEVGFVPEDWPNLFLPDRLWMMLPLVGRKTDMRWLTMQLAHGSPAQALRDTATGTSGSMKNISKPALRGVLIPSPEPLEQSAIAEALSDVDRGIAAVEAVIAKKRALKTATMQALLSGTRRLPGFSSKSNTDELKQTEIGKIPTDWEVVNLGDIGKPVTGLTYSPQDVRETGTLVLRSSNVQNGALAFENNVYVDPLVATKALVLRNDILICVRNGSRDLIGKRAKIDARADGMAFGAFMSVFRSADHSFVFHQFQSDVMRRQINEHLGATINQITNGSLVGFKIPWPTKPEERQEISCTLSGIDDELAHQESKLAKLRHLKTGMMQQLLTGKIRLI